MTTNHSVTAALFSVLLLAAGSAAAENSLDSQFAETESALQAWNTGVFGREEMLQTGQYLVMARSLAHQGRTAQAQQYLNVARGLLRLPAGLSLAELDGAPKMALPKEP
ncbi:hypothetical protein [Azospirillum sp. TSO35-2]|uniref:hypothetical protein n=1 Tax=Azospirillum sp. TSO35-2 TaxID=716796 RepID=UPI000D6126AB|nr:hypothetical protein [Azospirillum sp. TSO35-2]PWC32894.1 hypothetical protein TSO352_20060 [Azospirillum sp. TSO35-2]